MPSRSHQSSSATPALSPRIPTRTYQYGVSLPRCSVSFLSIAWSRQGPRAPAWWRHLIVGHDPTLVLNDAPGGRHGFAAGRCPRPRRHHLPVRPILHGGAARCACRCSLARPPPFAADTRGSAAAPAGVRGTASAAIWRPGRSTSGSPRW